MGLLKICKSDTLVRYGSSHTGCECECVSSQDPNFIYTDGCLFSTTGQGGYAVYSSGLNINLSNCYPYEEHKNQISRIELKAILEAIRHIKLRHKPSDSVDIFTDCEFALAHLVNLEKKREAPEIYNNLGASILKEIKEDKGWPTIVYLHKVKAHSGIQGNEQADQYAKLAAKKAPKLDLPAQATPSVNSLLCCSRKKNDEFYSKTSASFSSCRKRSRVSQAPAQSRVQSPSPSPYKTPRRSSPSPAPASYCPIRKTNLSAAPRNHPYNCKPQDPKAFPSNSSKYIPPLRNGNLQDPKAISSNSSKYNIPPIRNGNLQDPKAIPSNSSKYIPPIRNGNLQDPTAIPSNSSKYIPPIRNGNLQDPKAIPSNSSKYIPPIRNGKLQDPTAIPSNFSKYIPPIKSGANIPSNSSMYVPPIKSTTIPLNSSKYIPPMKAGDRQDPKALPSNSSKYIPPSKNVDRGLSNPPSSSHR